ncbi:MAG: type II secretion system protein [Gammaproteobacteria bacterium]|nr:type II secretion system protein [Gammaproteobacteria bacterium]
MINRANKTGFTLIELVVVITLTGIVALLAGRNITAPIQGFLDLSRRAALVDEADLALNRMAREIRLALPNSVRITDGASTPPPLALCVAAGGTSCAVEILRTLDGSRYREDVDSVGAGDTLDFTAATDTFDVLGTLPNLASIVAGAGSLADCQNGVSDCLVVYNLGFAGADAYNGDNIAGIVATAPMEFIRPTPFPFPSPNQRFHVVDMPVTFTCNSASGNITRYEDYSISAAQVLVPGGTSSLMAGNISNCIFRYDQGAGSRNAVLTVELTVSRFNPSSGNNESIRMVDQIRVPNIP